MLERFDEVGEIIYDQIVRGEKVQGWVPAYERWVIRKLMALGLEGVSESDIVSNIIRDWIRLHRDDHAELGITPRAFLEETGMQPERLKDRSAAPSSDNLYPFKPPSKGSARRPLSTSSLTGSRPVTATKPAGAPGLTAEEIADAESMG